MKLLLEGETTTRLQFRTLKPSDFDTWLPFHEEPLSTQYWEGLPKDPYTACKQQFDKTFERYANTCLLYTSPSPRDRQKSRMPSSA